MSKFPIYALALCGAACVAFGNIAVLVGTGEKDPSDRAVGLVMLGLVALGGAIVAEYKTR